MFFDDSFELTAFYPLLYILELTLAGNFCVISGVSTLRIFFTEHLGADQLMQLPNS